MSMRDFRSHRMSKTEARKKIAAIMNGASPRVVFTRHAEEEMLNDYLSSADVVNVLKSPNSRITDEPEFKNGTFRYRLKTTVYCVVVAFQYDAKGLIVVTVFKITRERR